MEGTWVVVNSNANLTPTTLYYATLLLFVLTQLHFLNTNRVEQVMIHPMDVMGCWRTCRVDHCGRDLAPSSTVEGVDLWLRSTDVEHIYLGYTF